MNQPQEQETKINIDQANLAAAERMLSARPVLSGMAPAREVIPGMRDNLLLHAGPPIEWERASGPLRGAFIGALLFEGLAKSEAEAVGMIQAGEVDFEPCHHHNSVGPMAGVTSASMQVYIVENLTHGNKAYSNLNEGYGKVLRYGAFGPEVLQKLRWMHMGMGPLIAEALAKSDGIDMRALLAEALHMGDEGHNRNKAGSLIFLKNLAPRISTQRRRAPNMAAPFLTPPSLAMPALTSLTKNSDVPADVLKFLGDNPLSVLNPVMAACKVMCDAAHGVRGSSIVTTMARNGTEFGIRVSGLGERWFTAPAQIPDGLYFSGFSSQDANPDIGDSTITETAGIGGFAMAAALAIVTFIGGKPQDALNATLEMYAITIAENDHFTIPALDFRGTPTGIDIRKVVELGITPRINTGIAHKEAGIGQVGAGLVRPPLEVFEQAAAAHAEMYG